MTGFWNNKRVFLTGHTGFKGSWLNLWLKELGANVFGYALEPEPDALLFQQLNLANESGHFIGNVLDREIFNLKVIEARPDVIIHLAAQPLVRRSYRESIETWQTNVIGTIHLLEAIKNIKHECSVIIVTTDKVYENLNRNYAYKEEDRLGGNDPYSSSKSAAELAVNSWRSSFFKDDSNIKIATVRAGNVIGGGDWSEDRIVPDLVRALIRGEKFSIRNPKSVRPWQHVLDPLSGYLLLAERLYSCPEESLEGAYNFGPDDEGVRTVQQLVDEAHKTWSGEFCDNNNLDSQLHEEKLLSLDISKSKKNLSWSPRWGFEKSVHETISWYSLVNSGSSPLKTTLNQLDKYSELL
ncbi:MAG: CDP-glucose 4,6-dehydratase [Gammaproteobacteria bacterium]|nr:CDP-glucose 4,6-dehydratase [Gammaproteobacteria bacterium]